MFKWNTSSCGIGFGRCSRHCSIWSRISEPLGTRQRNMKHTGAGRSDETLWWCFTPTLGLESVRLLWTAALSQLLLELEHGNSYYISQEKGRRISPVPRWLDILSAWHFLTFIAQVWLFTFIFHAKCVICHRCNHKKTLLNVTYSACPNLAYNFIHCTLSCWRSHWGLQGMLLP